MRKTGRINPPYRGGEKVKRIAKLQPWLTSDDVKPDSCQHQPKCYGYQRLRNIITTQSDKGGKSQ